MPLRKLCSAQAKPHQQSKPLSAWGGKGEFPKAQASYPYRTGLQLQREKGALFSQNNPNLGDHIFQRLSACVLWFYSNHHRNPTSRFQPNNITKPYSPWLQCDDLPTNSSISSKPQSSEAPRNSPREQAPDKAQIRSNLERKWRRTSLEKCTQLSKGYAKNGPGKLTDCLIGIVLTHRKRVLSMIFIREWSTLCRLRKLQGGSIPNATSVTRQRYTGTCQNPKLNALATA